MFSSSASSSRNALHQIDLWMQSVPALHSISRFSKSNKTVTWLSVLVILYGIFCLLKALADPLRRVPGPVPARFTRFWELYHVTFGKNFEQILVDLHRRHGNIVRVAPNRYSIADPSSIHIIYGAGSKFSKTNFYYPYGGTDPHDKDIFCELDNAKHAAKRRLQTSFYSTTTLLSYEPFVDQTVSRLTARLEKFAEQQQSFNLFTWMQFYAFDVLGEIMFGRSFGLIEAGYDKDHLLWVADYLNFRWGARVGLIPELHTLWLWVTKYIPQIAPIQIMYRAIGREFAARLQGVAPLDREDMIAKCVKSIEAGKMTKHQMQEIAGQNIGAGSDTTGSALSAVIHFLMQNSRCKERLRAELNSAAQAGNLSDPVTFAQAQQLPYLQATIKEALRLHPSIAAILPRVVPEGGSTLAGTYFPSGTHLGMNPWVIHRDPEIWGDDVLEFKPERWLEKGTAQDEYFLAFGAGARTCIGKHISMLELSKLLPTLLVKFDFEPVKGSTWQTECSWFIRPRIEVNIRRLEDRPVAKS